MHITPYPAGGSGLGLTPLEVEALLVLGRHRGSTFYVDSAATGAADGTNWDDAVVTLDAAINLCAVDDRIFIAAGHAENITAAGGIEADVAGVTIVGLGNGDRKPAFTFNTATGADMNIGALGITIVNCRFVGGIDALTGPIDVNAADFLMLDCITEDSTGQATDWIVLDAAADRCVISRCTHRGATGAGTDAWITADGCDRLVVESPVVDGDFAIGIVDFSVTLSTLFKVYGGPGRPAHLHTRNSVDLILDDVITGSTGDVGPGLYCMIADNATGTLAEMTVAATGQFWDPIEMVNLAGESSIGTDIAATADAIV